MTRQNINWEYIWIEKNNYLFVHSHDVPVKSTALGQLASFSSFLCVSVSCKCKKASVDFFSFYLVFSVSSTEKKNENYIRPTKKWVTHASISLFLSLPQYNFFFRCPPSKVLKSASLTTYSGRRTETSVLYWVKSNILIQIEHSENILI